MNIDYETGAIRWVLGDPRQVLVAISIAARKGPDTQQWRLVSHRPARAFHHARRSVAVVQCRNPVRASAGRCASSVNYYSAVSAYRIDTYKHDRD